MRERALPVVAAVHGFCLGAALQLVALLRLSWSRRRAPRFGVPEGRIGLVGGAPLVPIVGRQWAKFLILTGELIDAERRRARSASCSPSNPTTSCSTAARELARRLDPPAARGGRCSTSARSTRSPTRRVTRPGACCGAAHDAVTLDQQRPRDGARRPHVPGDHRHRGGRRHEARAVPRSTTRRGCARSRTESGVSHATRRQGRTRVRLDPRHRAHRSREMFAAEGAKVAVTGRTVERGQKVVDLITAEGGEAAFFPLDVTQEQSVADVMDAVVERFGSLDHARQQRRARPSRSAPTSSRSSTSRPRSGTSSSRARSPATCSGAASTGSRT